MAGKSTSSSTPRLNHIAVQTSTYGVPLAIGWGTHRRSANLVWYGDFVSKSQKTSQGGKGGGSSSSTTYNYSAAVMMALGEGPITAIRKVYKDSQVLVTGSKTALAQAGLNLFPGAVGQATWGYMTTNHSAQALGYSYTPIVYASGYALNTAATLQNHSFEVQSTTRAIVSGSTIDDANPADIITDFLTNSVYGVPQWGSGLLASLTTVSTYCTAANLFLSPVLDGTRTASDFLTEVLDAANCEAVWSGGQLKIIPYGDTAITNNGVTYTPSLTPVYSLTNDDFLVSTDGDDPVKVQLQKTADSYNAVQIEFRDRSINYNTNMAQADDQANINQYGLRREDPHTLNCVCDATVASNIAQLRVQRQANKRRTFSFTLDWRYCLLEPMDLVTLTSGDLSLVLVRITECNENADGTIGVVAEEMLVGAGHTVGYARQAFQGYQPDTSIAPGSVTSPILINPPHSLTNDDTQIWLAVSGGAQWGGCQVYVSVDNSYFEYKGLITAPARYGTLTTALATGSDPDVTNSFGVDLTASLGSLATSSSAAADSGASMCLIDNELLSYQTATLTAANKYTVGTYLRRGQLGTTIAAHSIGAKFARLDEGIFKYSFNASQAGKTIYFKFVSFNVFGAGFEDITTVSTYSAVLSTSTSGSSMISLLTSGAVVPAVSATITGQGDLATANRATIAVGMNTSINSDFTNASTSWWITPNYTNQVTPAPVFTNSINMASYYGLRNVVYTEMQPASGTFGGAGGNFFFGWCQNGFNGGASQLQRSGLQCTAGDRILWGGLVAVHGAGDGVMRVRFFDSTGTLKSEYDASAGAANARLGGRSGGSGDPANFYQAAGVITVPSGQNIAYACVGCYAGSVVATETSAYIFMTAPYLVKGFPGQTAAPPYTPGPNDPLADKTYDNTALGVQGQTLWATYATLTPTQLTQKPANMLFNPSGLLGSAGWNTAAGTLGGSGYGASIGDGPYFSTGLGSAAAPQTFYQDVLVSAGTAYSVSGQIYTGGLSGSVNARLYIQWLDAARTTSFGYSTVGTLAPGTGWTQINIPNQIAPAGSVYGRILFDINGASWTNTSTAWRYLKMESNSVCTPYSDDVTYTSAYLNGQLVDNLKPAQAGADVTGSHVAASVTGQGTLATLSSVATTNLATGAASAVAVVESAATTAITTSASEFSLVSVSQTSTGGKHLISTFVQCGLPSGGNLGLVVRLYRDGSLVNASSYLYLAAFTIGATFFFYDVPGAGSHTYELRVQATAGSTAAGSVNAARMYVTEMRQAG
jgi:hypothetical protein